MNWEKLLRFAKYRWYERYTLIVGVGVCAIPLCAHTVFNEKSKNVVRMYKYAQPMEIHPRIHLLFTKVLKDLQIEERLLPLYDPFLFVGLDTYRIGASFFKSGAKIGIPFTYAYDKPEDINATNIYISKDIVDWTRPAAKAFLDTLVMSEAARKFAIAREVVAASSLDLMRELFSYSIFFVGANLTYWQLRKKYNLVKLAAPVRFFIYGAIATVSGTLWLLQDNYFNYWREKKIDEELSAVGPEYVKGGFEFYDKVLQRNVACRALMDEKSREMLTDRGEQNSYRYVFKKTLISDRRNFFATKLREVVDENSFTTPNFS